MKVGDLVQLNASKRSLSSGVSWESLSSRNGIVTVIRSRNWVKVMWSDGIILDEHVDDLKVLNESR